MGSLHHKNIKTVVLVDLNEDYFSDLEQPQENSLFKIIQNGARRSFEKLKGLNILVLLDNPWDPVKSAMCSLRPFSFKIKEVKCDFIFDRTIADIHKQAILQAAKEYPNVKVFDLSSLFCKDSNHCYIKINGRILYSDFNHFNPEGSLYVAPFIVDEIAKLTNK